MKRKILTGLAILLFAAALWLLAASSGWLGRAETAGSVLGAARPAETVETRSARQADAARRAGAAVDKQVLFGDFHVHTTLSFDAFMMGLPLAGGRGSAP